VKESVVTAPAANLPSVAPPHVTARPLDAPAAAWAWLAAWPIASVFMLANVAAPLYVVWQAEFGFSKGTLTAIFCWYMVGMAVSLLVSGRVSDRLGRKAVLLPALGLGLVAAVLFATAEGVLALSIGRVLAGAANGALVSAGAAAVTDLAGPGRKRLAALLGSVGVAVGTGFGPLWGGVVSETLPAPTSTVFWIQIVLLLTAIAVVARMPLARPADSGSGGWIRVPRVPAESRRRLLAAVAVAGPALATTSFMLSLAPSLLSEQLGTDNRIVAGAVAAVAFTASILSQVALKRLTVARLMVTAAAGTIVCAAGLLAAVATAAPTVLLVAAAFAGAAQGLGFLGGLSMLNQAVPATALAEANAAFNISIYALAGGLSLGLGYLSDAIGLGTAIDDFAYALIALTLIGLVFTAREAKAEKRR
jgi:predicted MFS family arabinose efflux permease